MTVTLSGVCCLSRVGVGVACRSVRYGLRCLGRGSGQGSGVWHTRVSVSFGSPRLSGGSVSVLGLSVFAVSRVGTVVFSQMRIPVAGTKPVVLSARGRRRRLNLNAQKVCGVT